jgi:excisionase family DNA binding protein
MSWPPESSLDPLEEIVTARVAAREKGVHPVSIYRAVREGRLKGARSGNTILIRRRDLAAWVPVGHRPRSASRAAAPEGAQTHEAASEAKARQIQRAKNQAAMELLRRWRTEGDPDEQREAFECLKQTLKEDPLSYRQIYPDE